MAIDKLKQQIFDLANKVGFIKKVEIVDETTNTLKIKLTINRSCFCQVYINLSKNSKNYVVVLNNQRIYGLDRDGGKWHRHPWDNPNQHEFTGEISLEDFLFGVYKELTAKEIL